MGGGCPAEKPSRFVWEGRPLTRMNKTPPLPNLGNLTGQKHSRHNGGPETPGKTGKKEKGGGTGNGTSLAGQRLGFHIGKSPTRQAVEESPERNKILGQKERPNNKISRVGSAHGGVSPKGKTRMESPETGLTTKVNAPQTRNNDRGKKEKNNGGKRHYGPASEVNSNRAH